MNNRMEYKYGDRNVRDRYIRDERGKRDKDRWLKRRVDAIIEIGQIKLEIVGRGQKLDRFE